MEFLNLVIGFIAGISFFKTKESTIERKLFLHLPKINVLYVIFITLSALKM